MLERIAHLLRKIQQMGRGGGWPVFRRWNRCAKIVGIACLALGVILMLASLPGWVWIFLIGAGLVALGLALLCC